MSFGTKDEQTLEISRVENRDWEWIFRSVKNDHKNNSDELF